VAPVGEVARGHRGIEQAGAVQRVGHRARAVVAGVVPLAVPAAVLVRLAGDLVARRDDRLHLRWRAGRGDGQAVGADLRAVAGGQWGRLGGRDGLRARARVGLADRRPQRVDVARVHDPVDGAVLRGLEALDRLLGARAELAVDRDLEARPGEEVLEDADVVA